MARGESKPEARGCGERTIRFSRPHPQGECHGSLMPGRGSEAGYKPSCRDLGTPAQLGWKALSWDTAPSAPGEKLWGRQSWEKLKWLLAPLPEPGGHGRCWETE